MSAASGVWRTPEGFALSLSEEERELLRNLQTQLTSLLAEAPADPSLRRLFPPAYEEDDRAEEEYRELMQGDLTESHREALGVVEQTIDREYLVEAEAHSWLAALNSLRLALGTRLGVTEELYDEFDPRGPDAPAIGVYLYLTWLQEQFVEALATGL
ncbi:MAG TPA: DUF2017 family protein [Gaiellaceae bacterium]|nr:DUF2017 family protein [Gaiellaceae bacterium]